MADVLGVPRQPDGQSYFETTSTIKRPPSSSSLFLDSPSLSSTTLSNNYSGSHAEHQETVPGSSPCSSLSSSPQPSTVDFSDTLSTASTPASSSGPSLEERFGDIEDDIEFPNYDTVKFYHQDVDFEPHDTNGEPAGESSDDPTESATTDTTRSDSPLPTPIVADDSAINTQPSRHVDYLSHDWREEDIWSSWRHVVSQRRVYGERSRLENASWRTWAKTKNHLATVSPETLNWLKESDVTWLYGPLKPASSHPITKEPTPPSSQISTKSSFVRKPILKKRSVSEVMLQKSLSTTSLVKQAAASIHAQNNGPARAPVLNRSNSDLMHSNFPSEVPSRDQFDYFTSRSESVSETPSDCAEKRHIRFDDKVEQCIAIDNKDAYDVESESEEEENGSSSDSDSDDGVIMMKPKKRASKRVARNRGQGSRSSSQNGRKTIETLPATTLKYRTDSPDVTKERQQHTFGRSWGSGKLSPSPSQETLRPSHPSKNFLLAEDDNDELATETSSWSFGASNPKSSLGAAAGSPLDEASSSSRRRNHSSSSQNRASNSSHGTLDEDLSIDGLRRTESGMFMPYDEEDEDDLMAVGLFGRVSETINTARDIAHVIWNVGWRK
ncbi:Hypothetical protein R9X50_00040900 [Acrodontium crateriforme]|uniref:Nitrogen regulatory protein areA GATA-like domain-containing protein n=1 Tax=Acrodontium crateriforme TaxID=150365 RepID=A0AAQ3R728_9PEZI|nr:Hypothetical protein R9X50_00040900 [Acrodontium crateriforme]